MPLWKQYGTPPLSGEGLGCGSEDWNPHYPHPVGPPLQVKIIYIQGSGSIWRSGFGILVKENQTYRIGWGRGESSGGKSLTTVRSKWI